MAENQHDPIDEDDLDDGYSDLPPGPPLGARMTPAFRNVLDSAKKELAERRQREANEGLGSDEGIEQ
jgi:hypothetical protein